MFDSGSGLCSHTDTAAASDVRERSQYLSFPKLGGIHNVTLPSDIASDVCLINWGEVLGVWWCLGFLGVLGFGVCVCLSVFS